MIEGKIVVVMGGPSSEAEVSRRTGGAILAALKEKGYDAEGLELVPDTFMQDIQKSGAKIVFNALHGKYGEDGVLQGALDMLGIPYTGSGVLAAALTMNKVAAKRVFIAENIPTPRSLSFHSFEAELEIKREILENFSLPVVVKAASQGSSIGVYIVEREEGLAKSIKDAFTFDAEILVEEFIKGREITVAVWGNAEEQKALPVIEITTKSGRYDYESKYTKGASSHIIPAPIGEAVTKKVQDIAVKTFIACGMKGVARIDMMLDGEKPYVIEVNSVPGMTETSLVPDAARAMGLSFPDLCERILSMAKRPAFDPT